MKVTAQVPLSVPSPESDVDDKLPVWELEVPAPAGGLLVGRRVVVGRGWWPLLQLLLGLQFESLSEVLLTDAGCLQAESLSIVLIFFRFPHCTYSMARLRIDFFYLETLGCVVLS